MESVRVRRTRRRVLEDGRHRTVTAFVIGGERHKVWFDTSPEVPFLDRNLGDVWLGPALLIAMRRGVPLQVADPISPGRLSELEAIQDRLASWHPDRMRRVPLSATEGVPHDGIADDRVVASCFTGGVDAFHTLHRHRHRLGALVYGFGLDVPRRRTDFAATVHRLLESVATETGVPLLTANTNIKALLKAQDLRWGHESHGTVLMSIGTVLATRIRELLIASTHTNDSTSPWGSHVLLDPRWSTDRLQVVYDGGESGRIDKTRAIAEAPIAQQHLRVCFRQYDRLNCGRCPKCIRTMGTLETLGKLEAFTTFPHELDLRMIRDLTFRAESQAVRLRDVRDLAASEGRNDLADALTAALQRYEDNTPTPWTTCSSRSPKDRSDRRLSSCGGAPRDGPGCARSRSPTATGTP